ncbi:MAG: nucleoside deaminase [Acidobacteriota bacterium]
MGEVEEIHRRRMRDLVDFTASSFDTEHPSPFGSSVYETASGRLVARAYDTVIEACDPTNHGEVNAIRLATRALGRLSLRGCVLYSTCEPCPMCMSACIWAEVDTVVYGASTLEDADRYWPQASDLTPQELVAKMRREPRCEVLPQVERALCRELFSRCDAVRNRQSLQLPPHR